MKKIFASILSILIFCSCNSETLNANNSSVIEMPKMQSNLRDDVFYEKKPIEYDKNVDILEIKKENTIKNNFSLRPYYKTYLNEESLILYNKIFNSLNGLKPTIEDIPLLSNEDIAYVYDFVRMDNPQFFYMPRSFNVITDVTDNVTTKKIHILYKESFRDISNVLSMKKEIDLVAERILLEAAQRKTQFDKVKYIYDWLINNITYAQIDDMDSIYGAMVLNKTNCEGYSEAFAYLLNQLGIETIIVVGESREEAHQWNMVNIDNEWYYFDVTWGVPSNERRVLPYNYFAITEKEISKSHNINHLNILPKATAKENNYYSKFGLILNEYNIDELKKIALLSIKLNNGHISFKSKDEKVYKQVVDNIKEWLPLVLKHDANQQFSYIANDKLLIVDAFLDS